jgi:hypothetical protein
MPARAAEDAGSAAVGIRIERHPGIAPRPDSADETFGVGTEGPRVGHRGAERRGGREGDEGTVRPGCSGALPLLSWDGMGGAPKEV